MIKKICLTILFAVLTICITTAQQNKKVTKEQLSTLKQSTLFVVFDDNLIAYNVSVKAAVEKNWTLTPVKCVSYAEFEQLRANKNNFFLLLTRTSLTKDKRQIEYEYLNFLMGDNVELINDLPEVLTLPLAYTGTDDARYAGKLPVIIRFAQQHISKMLEARGLNSFFNLKNYNDNIKDIKKKTLLVVADDLGDDANTIEKIKAGYPYDVKIVSMDDLDNAIDQKTPNTLILFVVHPGDDGSFGRNYKMIFDVTDGKMYFYYYLTVYQRQPSGFTAKDFRRIAGSF
jgi:hypothetical protein